MNTNIIKNSIMEDNILIREKHFKNFINFKEGLTQLLIHTEKDRFIISMLFLKNKNKGIGSKVLNACIAAARNAGYKYIILESVLSAAIIHLADKLNFKPIDKHVINHDGVMIGDYILNL